MSEPIKFDPSIIAGMKEVMNSVPAREPHRAEGNDSPVNSMMMVMMMNMMKENKYASLLTTSIHLESKPEKLLC